MILHSLDGNQRKWQSNTCCYLASHEGHSIEPLYCPNELGTFMSSSMSRAIQPTMTNIFLIYHLYMGTNSIVEDARRKISSFQQNSKRCHWSKSWSSQVGATSENLVLKIWKTWWMRKFNRNRKVVYFKEHKYIGIWVSTFGVHKPTLEVVNAHWLNDKCLSQQAWIPILEHVWFVVFPMLLNMVALVTCNPHVHGNFLPPSSLT